MRTIFSGIKYHPKRGLYVFRFRGGLGETLTFSSTAKEKQDFESVEKSGLKKKTD